MNQNYFEFVAVELGVWGRSPDNLTILPTAEYFFFLKQDTEDRFAVQRYSTSILNSDRNSITAE
jgi:hypothetical protein